METASVSSRTSVERRVLLIGRHKNLLFEKLCAAAEKVEKHVQYNDLWYLNFRLDDEPVVVELTKTGTEHTGAREMAIRKAEAVILSYAAHSPDSFNELTKLLDDFKMRKNKNSPMLLVRNEDEYIDVEPPETSSSCTSSEGYESEDPDRSSKKHASMEELRKVSGELEEPISEERGQDLAKLFGPQCEQVSYRLSDAGDMKAVMLDLLRRLSEGGRRQRRRSTFVDGLKNAISVGKVRKADKDCASTHSSTSDIGASPDDAPPTPQLDAHSEPPTPAPHKFKAIFKRNQTAPAPKPVPANALSSTPPTHSKACAIM